MAKKIDINKPDKRNLITIREIMIIAVVALVIFLITCDRPVWEQNFSTIRPSFWKQQNFDGTTLLKAPSAPGDDEFNADSFTIQDITEKARDYATSKDYVLHRVDEEQSVESNRFEENKFNWEDAGPFIGADGHEAYFFIYRPGGEYSGSKNMEVIIKKGDKTYMLAYRSKWGRFDKNFSKAMKIFTSFKIK